MARHFGTLCGILLLGVLSPAQDPGNIRLDDPETEIADLRDEHTLQRLLYGSPTLQSLSEEQADEMLSAARRRVDRQNARIERFEQLITQGVVARARIAPLLEELESRRNALELAESRANLFRELLAAIHREQALDEPSDEEEEPGTRPVLAERFQGRGSFDPAHFSAIARAFERQFGRPIPVSAFGDTPLHRSLGFDHRDRVDVALDPDQPEGLWLRRFLTRQQIPFYAFRGAASGRSTGAHIHIGPPSGRLQALIR
ncbi:MAG: hypothetical protein ACK5AZ_03115 [Bryobacteraceae bacterium]